jgi:hypothetical protein
MPGCSRGRFVDSSSATRIGSGSRREADPCRPAHSTAPGAADVGSRPADGRQRVSRGRARVRRDCTTVAELSALPSALSSGGSRCREPSNLRAPGTPPIEFHCVAGSFRPGSSALHCASPGSEPRPCAMHFVSLRSASPKPRNALRIIRLGTPSLRNALRVIEVC